MLKLFYLHILVFINEKSDFLLNRAKKNYDDDDDKKLNKTNIFVTKFQRLNSKIPVA